MASSTLLSQLASAPATISGRIRARACARTRRKNRRSSSRRRPTWRARGRRRRGRSPCAGTSPPRGPRALGMVGWCFEGRGVAVGVSGGGGRPPAASGLEGDAPASRSASSSRTWRSRRTSIGARRPRPSPWARRRSAGGSPASRGEKRGTGGRDVSASARHPTFEKSQKTGDGSRTRVERARTHRRRELELGRHRQAPPAPRVCCIVPRNARARM